VSGNVESLKLKVILDDKCDGDRHESSHARKAVKTEIG